MHHNYPMNMQSDWLTTAAVVELSGYHPERLRELLRAGKVRAQKWGRDWQISSRSLRAYCRAAAESGDGRRGAKPK